MNALSPVDVLQASPADDELFRLSEAARGDAGVIVRVGAGEGEAHRSELERRLLEMGFVEGRPPITYYEDILTFDRQPA